jgi:hypothetical protein
VTWLATAQKSAYSPRRVVGSSQIADLVSSGTRAPASVNQASTRSEEIHSPVTSGKQPCVQRFGSAQGGSLARRRCAAASCPASAGSARAAASTAGASGACASTGADAPAPGATPLGFGDGPPHPALARPTKNPAIGRQQAGDAGFTRAA